MPATGTGTNRLSGGGPGAVTLLTLLSDGPAPQRWSP
jgi:hypothetical protein